MRLSNRRKAPLYNFIHTVLILFFLTGIAAYLVEKYKVGLLGTEAILIIIFPLLLLVLFYLNGRQIFEYDSDGEALNFKNRNIIPILDRAISDEFPKYKLKSYNVVSIFFVKRLYVTITSKKSATATLKYEVSYLTKKEINDLKFSLSKVLKNNEERNTSK